MKKFLLFFLLIIIVNGNSSAATGCLRMGQVYTSPPSGWNQWTSAISDSCPSGALTSTQYAQVNSISSTACALGFWGLGGTGVLVNYDIEFCPIDDYIPLMLVMTAATSGFFLRRNFFNS